MAILNSTHTFLRPAHLLSLLTLLLCLLCTSCYKDFEPKQQEPPVLCLNAVITSGRPIAISAARTWRFSDGIPGKGLDINVTDAVIEVTVNGRPLPTLTYNPDYRDHRGVAVPSYCSDYCPAPGDHLEIRATHPTLGEATASVVMPQPVELTDVDYDFSVGSYSFGEHINIYRLTNCAVTPTFHDPADAVNYYIVELTTENPEPIPSGIFVDLWGYDEPQQIDYTSALEFFALDFDAEPLFQEHISIMEQIFSADTHSGTVFSDKQINGQDYTLRLLLRDAQYYIFNPQEIPALYQNKLHVTLSHISEDYYAFLISQWQSDSGMHGVLGDFGFGDPVYIHSNVSTGAGIIATRSSATRTIDLSPFTSTLPRNWSDL